MAWDEIYHFFEDIRNIAEQQLLLASRIKDDPKASEAMFELMERRQALTDKIDRLSEKKIPDYNEINNKRTEIMETINAIQEYDRQSQKLIEAVREQASTKLGNVRNSQKAYDAYVPNAIYTEGWFFDRKK